MVIENHVVSAHCAEPVIVDQQSISVRSFDFHQDYNFSVVVKPNGEAFVYSGTFDESYVQPVLVPFEVLTETESHGLRLH